MFSTFFFVIHVLYNTYVQTRELLAENLSLFNFRSELCRIKIDDFVHSVFDRSLRKGEL